jgi:DNA-binding transcriptional LysR family regulator
VQQCIGQHGDDAGDVGEEEQIDDENRQEGQYLPDDLLQANFADAGGDEEVHADGRGDLADGEVDDHDNTEEGLIDAIGADQRDQNGGEQGDGGDIIQEGAGQQYITQPALSRSISSLEKELGIKLVNRTTHTVSLTPAGRVFAEECRKIISTYQDGVQNALTASQSIVGRVRLGVPIDSFEPLAVKLVRAITEKHSGIHIELKFNTPTRLLRALDDDLVDVIIASGRPRSAESKYLLVDRRMDYVVVSSVHPLADREEVSFSELRYENFIAISRSSSIAGYQSIIDHASAGGFSPNIVGEAETVSSLLMMVACGVGITVLYKEHQPISATDAVRFIPLKGEKYFNRYLIWNRLDNSCLDSVLEVAKELFTPEAEDE